jgi:DNA-binding transcriptional LysR family regulator
VRGWAGIEPIAAGHALLRRAREVLGALDRLHAELDGFAGGVKGSVRVAAGVSAQGEDLPDDVVRDLRPGAPMARQAALLGRTVVHRMQVSSVDACLRIVAAGLGLAIVPAGTAAVQVGASRLVMRPLDEPWAARSSSCRAATTRR